MVQVQQQSQVETTLLGGIQPGMPVYDANFIWIGVIGRIHWGETTHESVAEENKVLQRVINMPSALKTYLAQNGYIEVQTEHFSGNYFVLPHQIADITADGLFLLCPYRQLVQH